MLATTTQSFGIPPDWNAAVREIRRFRAESEQRKPAFLGISSPYFAGNALTTANIAPLNNLEKLGWSQVEALETHLRLRTFAEDWDAPGMEVYDEL